MMRSRRLRPLPTCWRYAAISLSKSSRKEGMTFSAESHVQAEARPVIEPARNTPKSRDDFIFIKSLRFPSPKPQVLYLFTSRNAYFQPIYLCFLAQQRVPKTPQNPIFDR